MFQLLLVDPLDRIASVLQQVHQVHDLLLPKLEVGDLLVHAAASVIEVPILLDQLAHVFQYLLSVLISGVGALQRLGFVDLLAAYWQVQVGCRSIGEAQAHVGSIVSSDLQRARLH